MKSDVLVVGAGAIGLSIALALQQKGYKTLILDGGESGQASSAAAGVLFPTSEERASGPGGEKYREAISLWPEFEKSLGGGITRPGGIQLLEDNPQRMERMATLPEERVEECADLPYLSETPAFSLFIRHGRIARPPLLLSALRKALKGCIVSDKAINISPGRTKGEKGKYSAEHIVLALGGRGWGLLGAAAPEIVPLQGEALLLQADRTPSLPAALYVRGEGPLLHYGGGLLWLGGSYHSPGDGPLFAEVERIARRGREMFPWLGGARIKKILWGLRPMSAEPVAEKIENGLYIATGNGKDGILQAPLVAREIAEMFPAL